MMKTGGRLVVCYDAKQEVVCYDEKQEVVCYDEKEVVACMMRNKRSSAVMQTGGRLL